MNCEKENIRQLLTEELGDYHLDEESYERLLEKCRMKTDHLLDVSWDSIAEEFSLPWKGEALRKASQLPLLGGSFVKKYYECRSGTASESSLEELELKRQQLAEQEQLLRARMKQMRREERYDLQLKQFFNDMRSEIRESGTKEFPEIPTAGTTVSGRNMIVCLSDWHLGLTFQCKDKSYSKDLAMEYLDEYLLRVIATGYLYNVESVTVCCLGDLISGKLCKTIEMANEYNMVEQIKYAADLLYWFCSKLSQFGNVDIHLVSGNHSRLDTRKDSLHNERMEDLILELVKEKFSCHSGFTCSRTSLQDSGADLFELDGLKFMMVHGEFDSLKTEASLEKLCSCYDVKPDCILKGHAHTPATWFVGKTRIVQCGSLCGSGDQYSLEKRIVNHPSQSIVITGGGEIEAVLDIAL